MPKKKRELSKKTNVRVGNISDVSGNVNVAGGSITTHQTTAGLRAAEIKEIFDQLYNTIEARTNIPSVDKQDIKSEVVEIQSTVTEAVQKNQEVDEGFLSLRFRNIARMAPDILDVVVAALANPLAALGIAVKKIAQKAKEETTQA